MVMLDVYLPRSEVTLQPTWVTPQIVNRRCFMLKNNGRPEADLKSRPTAGRPVSRKAQGKIQYGQELSRQGNCTRRCRHWKDLFLQREKSSLVLGYASFSRENVLSHNSEMLLTAPYSPLPLPHPGQSHFRELTTPCYLPMALPS